MPGTKQDAARAFLSEHRDMLGGIAPESLKAIGAKSLRSRTYVRYQQHLEGVPIHGARNSSSRSVLITRSTHFNRASNPS